MRYKQYHPLVMLCLLAASTAIGANTSVPHPSRPIVVELFTSQGCSSCPPADALLGEIAGNPNVIALAFHVDYWDYLGWHDPFAMPQFTQRQRGYAQALQLSSVFTPQVIVDGRNSIVGSNKRALFGEINSKPSGLPIDVMVDHDALTISLGERQDHTRLDVMLVAYQSSATTPVGHGENSGHTLKEYNIVRLFRQIDIWDGKAHKFNVARSTLPATADKIAILVQQPNQGPIVGATAIAL